MQQTITAVTPAGVTGAAKNVVVTFAGGNATGVGLYTYFATVTFNANGGTGTMAKPDRKCCYSADGKYIHPRSLFTFANWNTAADGSGTSYADAASYPFAADITLYAIWNGPPTIIYGCATCGTTWWRNFRCCYWNKLHWSNFGNY